MTALPLLLELTAARDGVQRQAGRATFASQPENVLGGGMWPGAIDGAEAECPAAGKQPSFKDGQKQMALQTRR